jgi:hypothetical protein
MKARLIDEAIADEGEKMVEVRLRFWTNHIASNGAIVPKHIWPHGMARIISNPSHDLKAGASVPFRGLASIVDAVEKLFAAHGITLQVPKAERTGQRYKVTFWMNMSDDSTMVHRYADTFDGALELIDRGPFGFQRYRIKQGNRFVERGDQAGPRGAPAPERNRPE